MRVKGPMFSLSASGSIGGVVTAATWKGRPYFRTLVTPSNPRSGGQMGTRAMFAFLGAAWASLPDLSKASWEALAASNSYSPFNGYQSYNMAGWTQYDAPLQASDDSRVAVPGTIDAFTVTPGVRQVQINLELGNEAANWGVMIFRDAVGPVTTAPSNAVKAVAGNGATDLTLIDTPVAAGTYGYAARSFSNDGNWGGVTQLGNVTVT